MFSLFHKFIDIKLKNKLILTFLLVVFIPVVFVGMLLTSRFRQSALNNAEADLINSISRVKKLTADVLKVPVNISNSLFIDKNLRDLLNTEYETIISVVDAYAGYKDFSDYLQNYSKQLSNIRIYVNNPTLVANWSYLQADEGITEKYWYKNAIARKGLISWEFIEDETKSNAMYPSLVRKINFPEYSSHGVLVISVDKDYLNSILQQEIFGTMLIDSGDRIIASNDISYVGRTLTDINIIVDTSEESRNMSDVVINNKPYRVVVDDLSLDASLNGLKIVSVFSVDSITKESNSIMLQGFLIVLASFMVSGVMIYGASYLISNRINQLNRHMRQVAEGDLDTVSDIRGGDEIGQLSRQFNNMVKSIKQLIYEVNESNIQKNLLLQKQNELRISMMASQITPHFLFNTLESIRIKLLVKGEAETSQIVKSLGRLMRRKLEINSNHIALEIEMEMVQCYLMIEKFRYGNKLSYALEIAPDSEKVMIPALTIQPLVENAVRHGLAGGKDGCRICVQAFICDEELHIKVTDNGEGIEDKRLKEILKLLNSPERREDGRIGLHNVHTRLKLLHGEKYGLTIKSKLNEGTLVSFSLPVRRTQNV